MRRIIDTVVKRTDGVPLFAEELTRLMLEGDGHRLAREIPVTLQDSLMARLDRLGPAREVAQVGAVLGREFSYELLRAVSSMLEAELQAALTKLTDAELIYARGSPPEAQYQFKHALIQDAAYEALLKSRRKELHRRAAETLTQRFAAVAACSTSVCINSSVEGSTQCRSSSTITPGCSRATLSTHAARFASSRLRFWSGANISGG